MHLLKHQGWHHQRHRRSEELAASVCCCAVRQQVYRHSKDRQGRQAPCAWGWWVHEREPGLPHRRNGQPDHVLLPPIYMGAQLPDPNGHIETKQSAGGVQAVLM